MLPKIACRALFCGSAVLVASSALAQDDEEEEVFELSPFTVQGSDNEGYRATSTLAGTRIRTDLRDVGAAISVVTDEFLKDTGATDNESLLMYTPSTEVGGPRGNFAGVGDGTTPVESFEAPSQNTRVRGLAAADNTRGYFLSDVPWDGYNVNRIDMQRGPNAILFGLGSPAGIINATMDEATFQDQSEVEMRFGSYGSTRLSLNANKVILEDELAVRVAMLMDNENYRQDPAFEDDERLYLAIKYDPKFLNGDSFTTSFGANYETGQIESNRPRTLTPMDRITPFFNDVGAARNEDGTYRFPMEAGTGGVLYDPSGIHDATGVRGGQANRVLTGNVPNPNYVPALAEYGRDFGGILTVFNDPNSNQVSYRINNEAVKFGGIGPDGQIDGSISMPFSRMSSVGSYSDYATKARLPFGEGGVYKDKYLQDSSIFDFYNHLIDGPNKEESSDFGALNLSLAQTFMEGKLGYELAYYDQTYDRQILSLLSNASNTALMIDTNAYLGDGSPNPNAGRPFISDSASGGNNQYYQDRDAVRLTAFFEHDFQSSGQDGFLPRLLGKHTVTGLYAEDNRENSQLNFQRYLTGPQNAAELLPGGWEGEQRNNNKLAVNTYHYLGDSLLGRSSASGANIPPVGVRHTPTSGTYWSFDPTWNAPSVDPAAPWNGTSTQSENPANYVGWSSREYQLIDALQGDNMYQYGMATSGSLVKQKVESEALVWQGAFWDHAFVGTYGWRKDTDYSWANGSADFLDPVTRVFDYRNPDYNLDFDPNEESGQSQTWSAALHLDRLIGEALPLNVSLYYNESENFQPGAGRVDVYGRNIPSPSGSTTDKSILLATRDNKYSLRVTDYETTIKNQTAGGLGTWVLGTIISHGTMFANQQRHNINIGFTLPDPSPNAGRTFVYEYPEGQAFEDEVIASFREFASKVPQEFLDAWGIEGDLLNDNKTFTNSQPVNLANTQDSISSGLEFEFTANPTKNWRISANASKTEAIRNNVGGEALTELVALYDEYLLHGPAGDLRFYSAANPGEALRGKWYNGYFRAGYGLFKLLEGTATPEAREWRFNMVTNYSFTDGFLRGVNIGGSYRWEDEIAIGYPVEYNDVGDVVYQVDTPYYGPTEDHVDLWVGYQKELTDKIDWKIQLNLRDVFAEKEVVPISAQPDGSWAAVRIPSTFSWTLSNTFSF